MKPFMCALVILSLFSTTWSAEGGVDEHTERNEQIRRCIVDVSTKASQLEGKELKAFVLTQMWPKYAARYAFHKRWEDSTKAEKKEWERSAKIVILRYIPKRLKELDPGSIVPIFRGIRLLQVESLPGIVLELVGYAMTKEGKRGEVGWRLMLNKDGTCTFVDLLAAYWISYLIQIYDPNSLSR